MHCLVSGTFLNVDNFPVLLEVYFSNEIETELKKYTFQYRGPLNVADVCIFLQKSAVFGNSTFTQSNGVRVVLRDILVLFSVFQW